MPDASASNGACGLGSGYTCRGQITSSELFTCVTKSQAPAAFSSLIPDPFGPRRASAKHSYHTPTSNLHRTSHNVSTICTIQPPPRFCTGLVSGQEGAALDGRLEPVGHLAGDLHTRHPQSASRATLGQNSTISRQWHAPYAPYSHRATLGQHPAISNQWHAPPHAPTAEKPNNTGTR